MWRNHVESNCWKAFPELRENQKDGEGPPLASGGGETQKRGKERPSAPAGKGTDETE